MGRGSRSNIGSLAGSLGYNSSFGNRLHNHRCQTRIAKTLTDESGKNESLSDFKLPKVGGSETVRAAAKGTRGHACLVRYLMKDDSSIDGKLVDGVGSNALFGC